MRFSVLPKEGVDGQNEECLSSAALEHLEKLVENHEGEYEGKLLLSPQLDRKIVSFQANKNSPVYRLFKYKEGFSASLVSYFIEYLNLKKGPILDPFSGTGTTPLVASNKGLASVGIELLPIGNLIAWARYELGKGISNKSFKRLKYWKNNKPWKQIKTYLPLPILSITEGAYPEDTERDISGFLQGIQSESDNVKKLLMFALCAILEEVSYTRKDGQYLRWDYRSNRRQGKNTFDKGKIYSFNEAICKKINDIIEDSQFHNEEFLFPMTHEISFDGDVSFIDGSCLEHMQQLDGGGFEGIITSPPYCNRYDYTRTYALELAVLGVSSDKLTRLRQTMLSCTVENREKDLLAINQKWGNILSYCTKHPILTPLLDYLSDLNNRDELNNKGIPRMVNGYFKEMACVIYECARVLRKGGYVAMVNDNVRYAGATIPVDIILSDFAQHCGLDVINIMVLPVGKGNSSQQMGAHGRKSLRKCVYVWRKA